jgi:hypothetical protein
MSRTPRLWHSPASAPPDAAARHRREAGQLLGIVVGGLIGLVLGVVAIVVWHARQSGSWHDVSVYLFGLPWLLLVGGAVIGGLLATAPAVEEVDAPVRDRRAVESGQRGASTDEQGQTAGSQVQPAYRPERGDETNRLPSQREPDDPDNAKPVRGTGWARKTRAR